MGTERVRFRSDLAGGGGRLVGSLVKIAKGEILFFTDARQLAEKGAFIKLIRNFRDEGIGC
ncbi:MAG: hypothetical protein ACYTF1_14000, partial [Planctomycetota bacterium]